METYQYDAFLSFAVEDKLEVANELYHQLSQKDLKTWYSGRELTIGESLVDTIREGLDKSKYGIVIVTHNYFRTGWTLRELGILLDRERDGRKVILPVLHKITAEEVAGYDPALALKWALSTEMGLDKLSEEIARRIKKDSPPARPPISSWVWVLLATGVAALCVWLWFFFGPGPTSIGKEFVQSAIEERVGSFQETLKNELATIQKSGRATDQKNAMSMLNEFNGLTAQYRNFYEFSNGIKEVRFRKYVAPATGIDFDAWTPANDYGFKYPNIYLLEHTLSPPYFNRTLVYFNTQQTGYTIKAIRNLDTVALATVAYTEPLRMASLHFEYSPQTSYRKHTTYTLKGFLPTETYKFARRNDEWVLTDVK